MVLAGCTEAVHTIMPDAEKNIEPFAASQSLPYELAAEEQERLMDTAWELAPGASREDVSAVLGAPQLLDHTDGSQGPGVNWSYVFKLVEKDGSPWLENHLTCHFLQDALVMILHHTRTGTPLQLVPPQR